MKRDEFHWKSGEIITPLINNKKVNDIDTRETGMDDWIVLNFKDGSALKIRYDYIYEWVFLEATDARLD